ncbi:hypothetical protein ACFX59_17095 [Sphingomonas sp. NCPPB 2930]|uniref:hypothetical protein n=1 Tax=Sphingomonas sp. NCPPB 2930 TaxID=3162788 RepID=UPI0036DD0B68
MITIIGVEPTGATVTMTGRGIYDRTGDGAFHIEFETPPALSTWNSPEAASRNAGR